MPRVEPSPPEDFRRQLREKALNHSLFYLKLSAGVKGERSEKGEKGILRSRSSGRLGGSEAVRTPATARLASSRVAALVRKFEPAHMQYLRPPRAPEPADDIASSDDDDRAAVRRRSRDLSDDSAVELEPVRRHSEPRARSPPLEPRRERTLVEAHVVELSRRGRCVRTPSVVVSDYSDGVVVGATPEEAAWLRARSLSADSACSSCSTLSSRDDEDFDSPTLPKKMMNAD